MNTTRRSVALRCTLQRLVQCADLRPLKLALAGSACALIVACGSFPYKVEVAQGNFVSKEQAAALKTGMPRAQVMDILGTPLLVSVFHADRWEYVFTMKRQGVESKPYKLTVFFKGDLLDKVDGSEMPTEKEFVDELSANKSSAKPPVLEMTEQELKATEKPAKAATPAPVSTPNGAAPTSYPPLESSPK
jgi:outer membrane protein assembly factor BamE